MSVRVGVLEMRSCANPPSERDSGNQKNKARADKDHINPHFPPSNHCAASHFSLSEYDLFSQRRLSTPAATAGVMLRARVSIQPLSFIRAHF
ncbi:MAG: hypothetical protein ACJ8EL_06600 [Rhizomicrobium sp.]